MKKSSVLACLLVGAMTLSSGCSFIESMGNKLGGEGSLSESEEGTQLESLMVEPPRTEVFPYNTNAKNYLEAVGANVAQYAAGCDNPQVRILIKWTYEGKKATRFVFEYATKADYSDALTIETDGEKESVALYNLYKGTKYYVRVTAYNGGEALVVDEGTFKTTSLGPRVMNVDGINNVRDLGGYETAEGKTTVQGLLYRGGTLTPADVYKCNITEEGKRYMSEGMGIKTEIDFRTREEAGVSECLIPNAKLHYVTLTGYAEGMNSTNYKRLFSLLAQKENYPIYFHCTGGADRTGTVAFLVNALLGVSEEELIQDYEFTSFSLFGLRNTQSGTYANYFKRFRNKLDTYEGETLQEKVESCLLSMGVTEEEIDSIKAIMYGEK